MDGLCFFFRIGGDKFLRRHTWQWFRMSFACSHLHELFSTVINGNKDLINKMKRNAKTYVITKLNEEINHFISLGLNAHIPQHFEIGYLYGFLTRVALYRKLILKCNRNSTWLTDESTICFDFQTRRDERHLFGNEM